MYLNINLYANFDREITVLLKAHTGDPRRPCLYFYS